MSNLQERALVCVLSFGNMPPSNGEKHIWNARQAIQRIHVDRTVAWIGDHRIVPVNQINEYAKAISQAAAPFDELAKEILTNGFNPWRQLVIMPISTVEDLETLDQSEKIERILAKRHKSAMNIGQNAAWVDLTDRLIGSMEDLVDRFNKASRGLSPKAWQAIVHVRNLAVDLDIADYSPTLRGVCDNIDDLDGAIDARRPFKAEIEERIPEIKEMVDDLRYEDAEDEDES